MLFEIGCDVVGVRGAVCEDSTNRRTKICPKKTMEFVELYNRKSAEQLKAA